MSDVTSMVEMSVAMYKAQLNAKYKAGLRRGAEIARARYADPATHADYRNAGDVIAAAIESEAAKGET